MLIDPAAGCLGKSEISITTPEPTGRLSRFERLLEVQKRQWDANNFYHEQAYQFPFTP
jgi:hypothetical protein